jgi:glycosyltransferase involved in cell wall biosynthesis
MTETRKRVLVSAYACGPGRASEPSVGWNAVSEIARDHDVWVLTSFAHRAEIEAALARESPRLTFVFLDWPKWLPFIKSTRVGFEFQHYCWQIAAYLKARALHREVRFDLAHHVTVCRYWMPSFLPLLDIPFVWGPVGGGESAPKPFWPGLGFRGALLEVVREVARFIGEHDPVFRRLAKRAALGVATTGETANRMTRVGVPRLEVCSQVALTESEIATLGTCEPSRALDGIRFISIGRLMSWKGFHLGLQAFARTQHPDTEYWIVGAGPAERSLKALVHRLGIADRVLFLGQQPRSEVLRIVQQCDVLVHPSLHESGGAVCAEAMAAGRPVICLDLGGPGLQVTAETGIKIPARTPEQAIRDMAAAMDALSQSPAMRLAMGRAARARVLDRFTTASLREQFTQWYREVTDDNRLGGRVETGDGSSGRTARASH